MKKSALYQLMDIRMNGITNRDYKEIIRKSDEYFGKLDELELAKKFYC